MHHVAILVQDLQTASSGVQDLHYTVTNSANWRETISLLSKVSGSFYPGELGALVSASMRPDGD